MRNQRKKIWIDRFQTKLSVRIALYFILYQVAVWSAVAIERGILSTLEEMMGGSVSAFFFLFLATPVLILGMLFIYDALLFAHRIVGPLYRFRRTIQAITAGEPVSLVQLRNGDFLLELRDDLNQMIEALEKRGAVELQRSQTQPEPSAAGAVEQVAFR